MIDYINKIGKLGIAGIVATIVIVVLMLTNMSGSDSEEYSEMAVDMEQDTDGHNGNNEAETSGKNHPAKAMGSSEEIESAKNIDVENMVAKNASPPSNPLREKVKKLSDQYKTLEEGFISKRAYFADIQKTKTSNESNKQQFEDVMHRIQALDEKVAQLQKKKTKRRKKQITRRKELPFKLIGIDNWGTEAYAIFHIGSRLRETMSGDILAGWRVESIDAKGGMVNMEKGKRNIKLHIEPLD